MVLCAGIQAAVAFTFPLHAAEAVRSSLWALSLGERIDTCPAIGRDGTIYTTVSGFTTYADIAGGKLAAVNPGGFKLWDFGTLCDIKSSPAIGPDDTIYFGSRDRKLHAISAAGKEKWSFETGAWVDASPAVGTNGDIYFGSWDGKFYALSPDGKKRWELATGGPVDCSAAIGTDGTVYFGSHDKKFYALNPDGKVKWSFATGGAIISSPAINAEGVIVFTSVDGRLYALNPDGTEKWHVWTGGVRPASPVIDAQGDIYVGVNDLFRAFKPDGGKKWEWGYPTVDGAAVLSADGGVYFGADSGTVHGFNLDGSDRTYYPLSAPMSGSPTIGEDGTIYVGAYKLHALKGGAGLAKGGWPKFHGGLRQTGRAGD
jgi:outer membrane protein assembly factor BamB